MAGRRLVVLLVVVMTVVRPFLLAMVNRAPVPARAPYLPPPTARATRRRDVGGARPPGARRHAAHGRAQNPERTAESDRANGWRQK